MRTGICSAREVDARCLNEGGMSRSHAVPKAVQGPDIIQQNAHICAHFVSLIGKECLLISHSFKEVVEQPFLYIGNLQAIIMPVCFLTVAGCVTKPSITKMQIFIFSFSSSRETSLESIRECLILLFQECFVRSCSAICTR